MTFIKIPYTASNDSIDRDTIISGIRALNISEDAKYETFEAIYNVRPDGVTLDDSQTDEIMNLERFLRRYRIPHHQLKTSNADLPVK